MARYRSARCPVCVRYVPVLDSGQFSKHDRLARGNGGECPMTRRRPAGPGAASALHEVLRVAFWEYFGLDSGEWGVDRDDDSAARAAVEALRTASFLVVDGQIYLVTHSSEENETAGERRWRITTHDEGESYELG
jgi:hypothetical protein